MPDENPDVNADYWTPAEVAAYWGVAPKTIYSYRSRGRGELPPPDRMFGRTPAWRPSTITKFHRPGQGARTDLSKTTNGDSASGADAGQP